MLGLTASGVFEGSELIVEVGKFSTFACEGSQGGVMVKLGLMLAWSFSLPKNRVRQIIERIQGLRVVINWKDVTKYTDLSLVLLFLQLLNLSLLRFERIVNFSYLVF